MSRNPDRLEIRPDGRGSLSTLGVALMFDVAAAVVIASQGGASPLDVVMSGLLAVLTVVAACGVYWSRLYVVTMCERGVTIDHPLEKCFVSWPNFLGARLERYGVVVLEVRDEEEAVVSSPSLVRQLKRMAGRPAVTVSTVPLRGGRERFLDALIEANDRWG